MHYSPAQRFQSAAEFRQALKACPESARLASSQAMAIQAPVPTPPSMISPAPKLPPVVKPTPAVPNLVVSPNPLTLSNVAHWSRTPPTATLRVTTTGSARGSVQASEPWLSVEPAQFGPNQNITITVNPRQVSLKPARIAFPNVWNQARYGRAAGLVSNARARRLDSVAELFAYAASMIAALVLLAVAGLAQGILWLAAQQARYLVVGPTLISSNLQFKYSTGTLDVPVQVQVVPSRLELGLRWLAVGILVAVEIGVVLWIMLRMWGTR